MHIVYTFTRLAQDHRNQIRLKQLETELVAGLIRDDVDFTKLDFISGSGRSRLFETTSGCCRY